MSLNISQSESIHIFLSTVNEHCNKEAFPSSIARFSRAAIGRRGVGLKSTSLNRSPALTTSCHYHMGGRTLYNEVPCPELVVSVLWGPLPGAVQSQGPYTMVTCPLPRQTNMTENITFPQLLAGGKYYCVESRFAPLTIISNYQWRIQLGTPSATRIHTKFS